MHGKNPIRPPEKGDGSTLDVQHIFRTIQGEGPYAGVPAVFIRLGGCNLACAFCDTEFENFHAMAVKEIMAQVYKSSSSCAKAQDLRQSELALDPAVKPQDDKRAINLIVITGGEPLRQPIAKLCEALIAEGFRVQIETNGTLWRELPDEVEIVCSPKNAGQGYMPVRPDLRARVNAFKFIVSAHRPEYRDVGDVGQDRKSTRLNSSHERRSRMPSSA